MFAALLSVAATALGGGASPAATSPVAPTLFVSPTGVDAGRCTRAQPCQSFNRAYELAKAGDVVEIAGGTYPNQSIRNLRDKLALSKPIVFQPAKGAVVKIDGALVVLGSNLVIKGSRLANGDWTFRMNQLRNEAVDAETVSRNVVFENLKASVFAITATRFITIRGGDFGPSVGCWPRGTTGVGGNGGEITPEMWCPVGSGYETTGNTRDFEPRIGPHGSLTNVWPHDIVIDGATIHDNNSLDPFNLHTGGLFLVSGYNLVIQNSHFYGNIVYDLFAENFTSTACCVQNFGSFHDVVLRNNRFEAPVDAANQPGGNGWISRQKNGNPEIHLKPREGEPWRNWTIERNAFDNGILLSSGDPPTFDNVRIGRNIGGSADCYAGASGLTWKDNLMRLAAACAPGRPPYGYVQRNAKLEPESGKAAVVRVIFTAAAAGERPAQIARRLRTKAPRVRGASLAWVKTIIANPVYLGGVYGPASAHPALVPAKTWKAAQKALRPPPKKR